jgi:protein arginine kinase
MANRRQRYEVLELAKSQIMSNRVADNIFWVDLPGGTDLDRDLLVERHLISQQHAQASADVPRGVAIGSDETFAIMANEEDHLRIQVLRSGMQLTEAFDQIERIDDVLEERLDYAYSKRFGYLTACPTNVGTGVRVSVMLHLPALKLTGEIDRVRRAARDMHLAVRGLFGEGSDATGDLYQISNQTTLGKTEAEILADFEHTVVPQIIAYEQQARQSLLRQREAQLDDKVWRAWALLANSRVIRTEETLSLLSHLRLGVNLGRIDKVDIRTINELFLLTQPAHLQRLTGCEMDAPTRRIARARLIRQRLGSR